MKRECEICDTEYEDTDMQGPMTCPKCGQVYEFDECIQMQLTDEQLELLRQDWRLRSGN